MPTTTSGRRLDSRGQPIDGTGEVIHTLFGMAHEGLLTPRGQPKLLHAMVVASEYADDTVFTTPLPSIALPIARMLAPLARALGYRAVAPKYFEESFWRAHVEQPAPPVAPAEPPWASATA